MSEILPYEIQHKKYLMKVFDSNVPDFFDRVERKPFESFLDNPKGDYFIIVHDNEILGSGGFCEEEKMEARICWLMIDRNKHGVGLGKQLMEYFEKQITLRSKYDQISLKTSQKTEAFYSKLGYRSTYFEKDHWAKGLDLYYMVKNLL